MDIKIVETSNHEKISIYPQLDNGMQFRLDENDIFQQRKHSSWKKNKILIRRDQRLAIWPKRLIWIQKLLKLKIRLV